MPEYLVHTEYLHPSGQPTDRGYTYRIAARSVHDALLPHLADFPDGVGITTQLMHGVISYIVAEKRRTTVYDLEMAPRKRPARVLTNDQWSELLTLVDHAAHEANHPGSPCQAIDDIKQFLADLI